MRLDKMEMGQLAKHEGILERERLAMEQAMQDFNKALVAARLALRVQEERYMAARNAAYGWLEDIISAKTWEFEERVANRKLGREAREDVSRWLDTLNEIQHRLGDFSDLELPEEIDEDLPDQCDEILREVPLQPE